jgi:hypothetical protein
LSSKREITRTSIRVRTAMAAQVREQGRYLGGRPPYGYRLGDAGPHPNKAHAAWGRRAHRLEPDPDTAHVVRWIFAQRLAGGHLAGLVRRRYLLSGLLTRGDVPACPETNEYGELWCPRGDLNTQTREISLVRGNHGTRVTRSRPARPGIPQGVRYLCRQLAGARWVAGAGTSAPAPAGRSRPAARSTTLRG